MCLGYFFFVLFVSFHFSLNISFPNAIFRLALLYFSLLTTFYIRVIHWKCLVVECTPLGIAYLSKLYKREKCANKCWHIQWSSYVCCCVFFTLSISLTMSNAERVNFVHTNISTTTTNTRGKAMNTNRFRNSSGREYLTKKYRKIFWREKKMRKTGHSRGYAYYAIRSCALHACTHCAVAAVHDYWHWTIKTRLHWCGNHLKSEQAGGRLVNWKAAAQPTNKKTHNQNDVENVRWSHNKFSSFVRFVCASMEIRYWNDELAPMPPLTNTQTKYFVQFATSSG